MKFIIIIWAFLLSSLIFGQKKSITDINTFIEEINNTVDKINLEQLNLQSYHQDLFRYYRLFDSTKIADYPYKDLSLAPTVIPDFLQISYAEFSKNVHALDSISKSIDVQKDMYYSQKKIDTINLRLAVIDSINIRLHSSIEQMDKDISMLDKEKEKNAYSLMMVEIEKINEQIRSLKKQKVKIEDLHYEIEPEVKSKLPSSYLAVLQLYQKRLEECKNPENTENIYHYFLPEKYFDKWILKKYPEKYWHILYLEDVMENPKQNVGIKTYFNQNIKSNNLHSLKNINSFNKLAFTYTPINNSPFGNSQKIFFVLILDISNSMNENYKLQTLKKSVDAFVEALRPNDKFAIILFSNTSRELVLPKDNDKEWIKYQIDGIEAFGNTFPENAIFRSYNIMNLMSDMQFKNQIILITDGIFDVTGKMKYHVKEGKKKKIRFTVINIDSKGEDVSDIKKLTEISNGLFYFIDGHQTYNTMVQEILRN